MKNYIFLLLFLLSARAMAIEGDAEIGEEYIIPLRFPKFSLSGEYDISRKFHGFADDSLRNDLKNRIETGISFEAGLHKYFNAGALLSFSMSEMKVFEPLLLRMGLFAKPEIPIGNRIAIFSRIAAGFAVDVSFQPAIGYYQTFNTVNFGKIYHHQNYYGWPFGGFGSATIGLEVFPFSRFGLAFEWGIKATLFHNRRSMPLFGEPQREPGAPETFNYMVYDMPLMATLHVIL